MGRWWIIPAIVALAAGLFPLAAEPASPASDGPYRPLAGDTTATPTASPFPTITPTVTPFPTVTPWATPEATATAAPTVNPRFPLVPGPAAPANGGTLPALGAVLLRWNLPSGAAQYQVQLLPANSDGPGINLIRNAAGSYTIPAPLLGQGPYILLPGTRYLWRVRASGSAASIAESDASWGRWSDFWTFRTARPSLTGLTASAPADGGVVDQQPVALVWGNRETSVFYYEIQVSRDSQFRTAGNAVASVWWNLVHGGAAEPLNSWRAPTLDAAATYYWRVRPRVQGGEPATEWGPTWRFSTAAGLPAPTATPPPTATPRPLGSPTPTATPVPQPHIAFISNRDGNTELYVMNTDGSGQTRLTANLGAEDTLPAWSPNGRYIAFSSGGSISVAAVDGSDTRSLANGGSRPAWSPDGLHIAFINSGDLYVMSSDGSNQTRITDNAALIPSDRIGMAEEPRWSPDGRRIAVVALKDGARDVWVMLADGTARQRLTGGQEDQASWSPDGSRLLVSSTQDSMRQIYTIRADGSGQSRLTFSGAPDYAPAWSPDGKRIAFVSQRDLNAEIYVMNADGGSPVRLTRNDAQDEQPAWSPDGRRIAFVSNREGNAEIYVMNTDGSGVTNLSQSPAADAEPAWSPR